MTCISLVLASFAMLAVIQIAFAGDELTVESKTSVTKSEPSDQTQSHSFCQW